MHSRYSSPAAHPQSLAQAAGAARFRPPAWEPITDRERAYTESGSQSQTGREHIPVARPRCTPP
eukprot:795424-Prorocentrum_minimum.AAC.2